MKLTSPKQEAIRTCPVTVSEHIIFESIPFALNQNRILYKFRIRSEIQKHDGDPERSTSTKHDDINEKNTGDEVPTKLAG